MHKGVAPFILRMQARPRGSGFNGLLPGRGDSSQDGAKKAARGLVGGCCSIGLVPLMFFLAFWAASIAGTWLVLQPPASAGPSMIVEDKDVARLRMTVQRLSADLKACQQSVQQAGAAASATGAATQGGKVSGPSGDEAGQPVDDLWGEVGTKDEHAVAAQSPAAPPTGKRALLIICYNRPQYLRRVLDLVSERMPKADRPDILVSQDGSVHGVTQVVTEVKAQFRRDHPDVEFVHWHHDQSPKRGEEQNGYAKLARHFKFALDKAFSMDYRSTIILEDDLEIAPDFFDYFSAVEPIVRSDSTLLAASAYNDLGQAKYVADPKRVLRSDFFPGLGWLLLRERWVEDLGPKWPTAYWDDWLREPAQRQGRHILRPEVSRTRTFGEKGVSSGQWWGKYLKTVRLFAPADFGGKTVDWGRQDLSYLQRDAFVADMAQAIRNAKPATLRQLTGPGDTCNLAEGGSKLRGSAASSASLAAQPGLVVKYGPRYAQTAKAIGIIPDVKAGVPRTALQGVVTFPLEGGDCRVFLVPPGGGMEEGYRANE